MSRLLCRLSGRPSDLVADLRRLLAIRLGDAPARPDLGLPVLPPWLPDHDARRRLQEAIAHAVRSAEPRLIDARVGVGGDTDAPSFAIRARLHDGATLGATARLAPGGRLGVGA
jgi:predicted component of type VI protein secretion system